MSAQPKLLEAATRPEHLPARKVLFICGSLNQTTQLHAVARQLTGNDLHFTPYYGGGLAFAARRAGLLEHTIGGRRRGDWCLEYLRDHHLPVDLWGRRGGYDLVVTCTDLLYPRNIRDTRCVVVQEGILDPMDARARWIKRLRLAPWLANSTALTGQRGDLYDAICVASEGYRDHFVREGVPATKIHVTGIPNFDHCETYRDNAFPYRGYVLVATSDMRELGKRDDRPAFIRRCLAIAEGREVLFKLHPNEDYDRAAREIRALAPKALVFQQGSCEAMIANCDTLVTQWSSVAFVGLALGKRVYSYHDPGELAALMPIQNGGTSARRIAEVCRAVGGLW